MSHLTVTDAVMLTNALAVDRRCFQNVKTPFSDLRVAEHDLEF